jgi:hypothetical protein
MPDGDVSSINYLQGNSTMIATKNWGNCECGCNQPIKIDCKFTIKSGSFYLYGHDIKRKTPPLTRPIEVKSK